jgi:hypothetical protein
MEAHTPGPWHAIHTPGNTHLTIHGEVYDVATTKPAGSVEREAANARLIAAAPELLEALKLFLAFYNDLADSNPGFMGKLTLQDYAQWNAAMMAVPRAIDKAEGK